MKSLKAGTMNKIKKNSQEKKEKEDLSQKEICSVYICCKEPDEKGDMKVEMSYEGDPILASYLVETARQAFESM